MLNNSENQAVKTKGSTVTLVDRCSLEITGVDEVISYDERTAELVINGVKALVEGEGLKVTKLSVGDGVVCIVGKITAVIYDDGVPEKKSIMASLFGK